MSKQFLTALIPLVLFWAIESFWGLKAALVAGCLAAVLELGYEKIVYRKIAFMTLASNFLVLGLGAISYLMDSGVAFKLQPAVMEFAMVGMMLFTRAKFKTSFLKKTFHEMPGLPEPKKELLLNLPHFNKRLDKTDLRLMVFFMVHGLILALVAVYGTTAQWILLKGVLFYVLLVLVMLPMYKKPSYEG